MCGCSLDLMRMMLMTRSSEEGEIFETACQVTVTSS